MVSAGRAAIAALVALWLAAVLGGSWWLWRYKTEAGAEPATAGRWPVASGAAGPVRSTTRPTLVVFIHPECPCSRATLRELGRLLDAAGDKVATHIVFVRPGGEKTGWERGENWDIAAALPGASVHIDQDGATATAFGVLTSGHTLLYDRDGRQRFSGGITAARGHEGDSTGHSMVADMLLRGRDGTAMTPVFGCALRDRGEPGS